MGTSRVKGIVDLFSEGTEVYLGEKDGKPVVIWVQKLNSFEIEEARADGSVRRSERMAQLGKADDPEHMGKRAEMSFWDDDQLATRYVDQKADEIYLDVFNDLQTDPQWRELLARTGRLPQVLDDAGAPPDDPRRANLDADNETWLQAFSAAQQKRQKELFEDARALDREALERAYLEQWRDRQTLDVFMAERRTTQMYYAMRVCDAVDTATRVGTHVWDHSACDHSQRLVEDRAEVRLLPDPVTQKVIDAIDGITITPREAGNSDAPASSSASSEPSSAAEAPSLPSSPEETPSAAPTS